MDARDIMRREVITVERWVTLPELAKLFQERCISGAPVVDEQGTVLGVVSQTDLVRTRREDAACTAVYHRETDDDARSVGMHVEEYDGRTAEDIMTPGAIAFEEDTPVPVLAREMLERHIHRVLITREGRLRGIVTTTDMLRALAARAPRRPPRRRHG